MEPDERAVWRGRIAEANSLVVGAKAAVETVVIDARKAGASWNVIAAGVGTTPQAARQRFLRLPEIDEMEQLSRSEP